ncbi:putative clathrin/coatomer adaptor, adaptin-like, armadillo-like helical, AP complex subunit beta [Helianthus annuus]|nr:putative clathrin/coatomer adaptor, adaptin-like, armadillo-like helical, AP complex subunit beta [Helianthus annuus]
MLFKCHSLPAFSVVKNVASQSLEVKKLVYLYLLHYAERQRFGGPEPLVRAWALRTMAGIRLHVISPLVLVAVRKCARDPSVYVRKCAANALPKLMICVSRKTLQQLLRLVYWFAIHFLGQITCKVTYIGLIFLLKIIGILLNDNSPGVVGAAAAAFASFDPELVATVSRSYLAGPDKQLLNLNDSDVISPDYISSRFTSSKSDENVKLLLQCTSPLLWSRNSAVVLAAAGVHWIMAPMEEISKIVKPLLFLLRSSDASKYVYVFLIFV